MKAYEILAPAGSIEQLKMAINNGADAVYLGLDRFNARMKAPNFTEDNLSEWVDYCHLFGAKVYVAINISLKNSEFQQAVETLKVVYNANADGVILTDLALIKIASTFAKPFEIVASTQLNAHDSYGANFLKTLGVDTVVCARECTFDDIKAIASTGVKVESFLHGALCVCQSGQCLFSSIVGGNSGNRGLCAQPCRKKYIVNGQEGYFLSPRDMYGLDVAEQLFESGASVFKIEGRNRRPEYAGVASQVYSKAFANNFCYSDNDKIRLAEIYNRGGLQNPSYLHGENGNVIFPDIQNHMGVIVGRVKGKGFVSTKKITKGDGLKVLQNGKEICGGIATSSGVGFVSAEFSGKVCDGMVVCRTTSVELCNEIASNNRTLGVEMCFTAYPDSSAVLTAKCKGTEVTVFSEFVVQQAQNKPLKAELIAQQLSKTGDSHYTITNIVSNFDNIFISNGQLNSLRRQVLAELSCEIISKYNNKFIARKLYIDGLSDDVLSVNIKYSSNSTSKPCIAVTCYDATQLDALTDVDYVIYKPEHINKNVLKDLSVFVYLDLPTFANLDYLKGVLPKDIGLVCHNIGQVQFARDNNFPYIAGSGLNIFNDNIASVFADADTFVYSNELSLMEISAFSNKNGLTFLDGNITLMKVVHCPYKAVYNCDCSNCKCDGELVYTDELGNNFAVVRRRDSRCTFEIVNGKKLSVVNKISKPGRFLIDFNPQVIAHYKNINNGIVDDYAEKQPYTKGRLFNKIY